MRVRRRICLDHKRRLSAVQKEFFGRFRVEYVTTPGASTPEEQANYLFDSLSVTEYTDTMPWRAHLCHRRAGGIKAAPSDYMGFAGQVNRFDYWNFKDKEDHAGMCKQRFTRVPLSKRYYSWPPLTQNEIAVYHVYNTVCWNFSKLYDPASTIPRDKATVPPDEFRGWRYIPNKDPAAYAIVFVPQPLAEY